MRRRNKVTVRGAALATPLHICLETLGKIEPKDNYLDKAAIDVSGILFVKDAP